MNLQLWEDIQTRGGVTALTGRTILRLTGEDRVRFLNGQITNDVRKLTPGVAMQALVTDLKAHIMAEVFAHTAEDGALYLDAEPSLRESLAARLERYIIADDVELTDVTDDYSIWHIFGPAAAAVPGNLSVSRLKQDGVDLWLPKAATPPDIDAPNLSESDFEAMRILKHVPRHPAELNERAFPAEAGLQQSAISFAKGCYIGQEIISRMKLTGKMPRVLMAWEAEGTAPTPGQVLLTADGSSEAGFITSATVHPLTGKACGLAYVKQSLAVPDSLLLASAEAPNIPEQVRIFPHD